VGVAVASAASYANHLHLAPDNHASISPLTFYRPEALPAANQQRIKTLKAVIIKLQITVTFFISFVVIKTTIEKKQSDCVICNFVTVVAIYELDNNSGLKKTY